MKSGGLLWAAALMMMMTWLAVVADAYYLSDKQASVLLVCFMSVTFCEYSVKYQSHEKLSASAQFSRKMLKQ